MNHKIATLEIRDAEQLQGVQNMFKLLDVLMNVYFPIFFTMKKLNGTFPGGPVTESLPASGGDMGLIAGPVRFYMPWGKSACVPQLLSLCSRTHGPQLLKPIYARVCSPQQEKSPQGEAHTYHYSRS